MDALRLHSIYREKVIMDLRKEIEKGWNGPTVLKQWKKLSFLKRNKMKYVLSETAELDIDEIFDYDNYKFGSEQAINYLIGLQSHFEALCKNPEVGRIKNELKIGLLSFPYQSHIIFYRIMDTHIRIIRMIHGSRGLPNHFSNI
jgi:toxin ParE1/3/4